MSSKPGHDSFVEVAKRKKNISSTTNLARNTRSSTLASKSSSTQPKPTVPSQITTSRPNPDETSQTSRVSNKSSRSTLEAYFRDLQEKREQQFTEQLATMRSENQAYLSQITAEKDAQLTDLKSEFSDAVRDYEGTIRGLEHKVEQKQFDISDLNKDKELLTADLFHKSQELAHLTNLQKMNNSNVVTNKKSSTKKKTHFARTVQQSDEEDDDTDDSSHNSVPQNSTTKNKTNSNPSSTPPSGNNTGTSTSSGTTPNNPTTSTPGSTQPFSSPLPQGNPLPGHSWAQYVDGSGQILWYMMATPAPPTTARSTSGSNGSTSFQTNLVNNPNYNQGNSFSAPPGCLQFHRPTWTKEIKDISCNSDEINDVKAWYEDLRSCLLSASHGTEILPKIENLSSTYDFEINLLPPSHQTNYQRAKRDFDALSSALRRYLTKKKTFSDSPDTDLILELHKSEDCGLKLLLKILGGIFPHLGAGYLDFVTEVTKLQLHENESIDTLLRKTLALQRKLEHSNQIHPPNSIIHKFLIELRQNKDMQMNTSSIFLKYNEHLQRHGPNVAFATQPYDVYQHLKLLGVDLKKGLHLDNLIQKQPSENSPSSSTDGEGLFRSPTAKAAFVQVEKKALYPDKKHTKHVTKASPRYNKCQICNTYHPFGPNPELRCPIRGEAWIPDWQRKAAAKYNATHPSEKPDPDFITAPPPVRSGTTKPTAKQMTVPVDVPDDSEDEFFDAIENPQVNDDDSSEAYNDIQPEIKMAYVHPDDQSCTVDSNGLYYY